MRGARITNIDVGTEQLVDLSIGEKWRKISLPNINNCEQQQNGEISENTHQVPTYRFTISSIVRPAYY